MKLSVVASIQFPYINMFSVDEEEYTVVQRIQIPEKPAHVSVSSLSVV